MNEDNKNILVFLIILCIWVSAFMLGYDFRNFIICFIETSSVLYLQEPQYTYCNIDDTKSLTDQWSK